MSLRRLGRGLSIVWFEWLLREEPYLTSLERGHEARRRADWSTAVIHFGKAVRVRPGAAGARLHLGHALKETGELRQAEQAYRAAIRIAPASPEAYVHLGHALKLQGLRAEAAEAYAAATEIRPSDEVLRELAGSRKSRARRAARAGQASPALRALVDAQDAIDDLARATHQMTLLSTFHPENWPAYLAAFPVRRPPAAKSDAPSCGFLVLIQAGDATPAVVRASLTTLREQDHADWVAVVLGGEALLDHPVASLADIDERILWAPESSVRDLMSQADAVVHLRAGVRMEPEALAWLEAALSHPSAPAVVYADHDHYAPAWRGGRRFAPVLYGAPGRRDAETMPSPALVAVRTSSPAAVADEGGADPGAAVIASAFATGERLGHLPVVLSSILHKAVEKSPEVRADLSILPAGAFDDPIVVVIPTRDQAAMLEACIDSFIECASRPELLRFVVLDNRSREEATHRLLDRLSREARVTVMPADRPFNWARFNNIGAAVGEEPLIVFANNDLKMLSMGWDDRVRRHLADPRVGVVGARLLYQDRTCQHVGILMGAVAGRPVHEGRGKGGHLGGPLDRWIRTREAAAVTGAFMAVRREAFERLKGFEESLAVAYNDIDFCLKVRSLGMDVLYAADIEAYHYESKTRGHANNAEKVAWDDAEFETLYRRWGEAALTDPYVSPLWAVSEGGDFETLQPVSEAVALDAIAGDPLQAEDRK